jgi:hypothetical protein
MVKQSKYTILYAPQTKLHIKSIDRKFYTLIQNTIHEQLSYTPDQTTRTR